MKKGFILTVILMGLSVLVYSQNASWNVNNTSTWVEAVGTIRSGGNNKEYTITVTGNISVPSSTENTFGSVTGLTITIQGNGTLTPSANGSLLYIGAGQMIIAKDLTLRGRNNNNDSVVRIVNGGTFRMEGRATVTGNTSSGDGGGVYVDGVFIMQDSTSVSGNTTNGLEKHGSGVYNNGTFTMWGGSISDNTGSTYGGGVCNDRTFTMKGNATIVGNKSGGGVYNNREFTMEGGTISGNTDGGVINHGGTFTMQDGTISGNTAYDGVGGGVNNSWRSNGIGSPIIGTFTMKGGTVSGNIANYSGGGVFNDSTFIMQGGTISGNTVTYNGGGVYSGGSIVNGTFIMQGGTISGNTAINGGGVYTEGGLRGGEFIMQGGTISGNTASIYGGGVYVEEGNRYNSDGKFTKSGGTIYGDNAEQNLGNTVISKLGHVVYNAKNNAWRNASAGPTLNSDSYGFWLNDGDVVIYPTGFTGNWERPNFNNTLSVTLNTIKSSSSNYLWVLQKISGNAYTFKRSDAANTMTITIRLDGNNLVISGDSGSGQDNWNGSWIKQR